MRFAFNKDLYAERAPILNERNTDEEAIMCCKHHVSFVNKSGLGWRIDGDFEYRKKSGIGAEVGTVKIVL